ADHDPNADRNPLIGTVAAAHIVSYEGELQQALLDLDAWVTEGIRPPASTNYQVDASTQVQVPPSAAQRKGVQPVVNLSVTDTVPPRLRSARNGADTAIRQAFEFPIMTRARRLRSPGGRADVTVGQAVTFSMQAEVPPGTGKIVGVEWDFE